MIKKFYNLFLLQGGERFKSLEGIRALAIFLVFNVHVLGTFHEKNYYTDNEFLRSVYKVLNSGHIGVDLFFVLSGFLIVRTISKSSNVFQFIANRYKRLLPVVFVTSLALVLRSHSFTAAFDNFSLLMFFTKQPLSFVNWSLTYEVYFYFFTALWFFYLRRVSIFRKNGVFLFGLLLISLFFFLKNQTEYFFIREPFRFIGFFWGIGLSYLYDSSMFEVLTKKRVTKWIWIIPLLMTPLLQVAWSTGASEYSSNSLGALVFYLLVQFQFTLLILSILDPESKAAKFFSLDFFRYLGTISYSFYVVHSIWGLKLTGKILKNLSPGQPKIFLTFVIGFILSTFFASVLFLCLEKPYFKKKHGQKGS